MTQQQLMTWLISKPSYNPPFPHPKAPSDKRARHLKYPGLDSARRVPNQSIMMAAKAWSELAGMNSYKLIAEITGPNAVNHPQQLATSSPIK
ncbi:hypothetical protein BJX76DRAFT_327692 [Aspergillus varians]